MSGIGGVASADVDEAADGRRLVRARNRERLLIAASEMFAARGYRGTTTRDLAQAAGITERTLFRHVATKETLFREAVIAPVEAFVTDFAASWSTRPRGSRDVETEVREFVTNLFSAVESEGHLLQAMVAAIAYEPEGPDLIPTLAPLLTTLDEIFIVEGELRGWTLDPVIGVRAIVGMALSVTIHADWLFAGARAASRDDLIDQLTRLITWGVAGHPSLARPGGAR